MSIFFLISSEGHFGVENMLVTLGRSLSRLGCRCVVGVFCDSRSRHTEVGEQAKRQGLEVEVIPCRGRWDWRAVAHIRMLLAKHSIEILHPHGYKADVYACLAASPNRTALVATSHNWPDKRWRMRAYAALDRFILRRFDQVVVISEQVERVVRRSGVKAEKILLISNGIDIERFRGATPTLKQEIGPDDSLVGFVGRLVADKGGAVLLRSAAQVLRARARTKFVLVGDGPARRHWQCLADQLGISDRVVFTGVRDDMPGVYASFDVLVLASLCEAMPMCVLEAMAAGRPVIATNVGAVPRLVIPDQTGLLVEPGEVNALAAAILQLLQDRELACRLGSAALAHVTEHFSADSMTSSYLRLYRDVLRTRHIAPKQAQYEVAKYE